MLIQVEAALANIRESVVQWESVERQRVEAAAWLAEKQTLVEQLKLRPAKLHTDAAQLEIAQLEVRIKAILYYFYMF